MTPVSMADLTRAIREWMEAAPSQAQTEAPQAQEAV